MCQQVENVPLNPFDGLADRYDRWFDSPRGQAVFALEVACLRRVMDACPGRWLELGVGTGRFAEALGVAEGLDPSDAMLRLAGARGVRTVRGTAEDVPYADGTFDDMLMVTTLCFLADPQRALNECARVLAAGGRLVVGMVPADSPWGELYARKGMKGHPFYGAARFWTCNQAIGMVTRAGFRFDTAASCLLTPPDDPACPCGPPQPGIVKGAGFVAMRFLLSADKEK